MKGCKKLQPFLSNLLHTSLTLRKKSSVTIFLSVFLNLPFVIKIESNDYFNLFESIIMDEIINQIILV